MSAANGSAVSIQVEGVGKRYTIGSEAVRHDTLREALTAAAGSAVRRVGRLFRRRSAERDLATTLWALRDVSFEIPQGEIVGVIGRNGAGKTTLLKILSRITPPTEGRVVLNGRVGSLLEVGTGFHPELTGRENVFLSGAILGMRRSEIVHKFDEIAAFAEIDRFLDTPVKRYSSGMYVRLAFSVAAHLEPEILLVDEVLAVGDASFQRKCLGKMGDVARSGRTVLFVSHNMEAVSTLCDRGVLLSQGRVVEDGPTNQVIETYLGSIRSSEGANGAVVEPEIKADLDAQVVRVRLLDVDDRPANVTDLMSPIALEIEFEVRRPFDNLVVAFQIKRSDGFLVFSSGDLDSVNIGSEELRDQSPKAEGRYRARVDLPAPLLNTGVYEVETVLTTPRVAVIDSVSGLLFEVVDASGGSFASCVFKSRREGLLAVPLRWKIERTGGADGVQRADS